MDYFKKNFVNLLIGKIEFPHDFTIVVGTPSSEEIESKSDPPVFKGSLINNTKNQLHNWMAFPVHKVILATQSEYFRTLLTRGFKESQSSTTQIEIPHIEPFVFLEILRFIYSGYVPSQLKLGYNYLEDGIALAQVADYFQLTDLHQNTITPLQEILKKCIDKTPHAITNIEHYDKIVFYLLDEKDSNDDTNANILMYLVNNYQRLSSESKITQEIKDQLLLKLLDFHMSYYSR